MYKSVLKFIKQCRLIPMKTKLLDCDFQQNWALSHGDKSMLAFLNFKVKNYQTKNPNSPDFNPLDFSALEYSEEQLRTWKFTNTNSPKKPL